jgi:hypothetical protein
MTTAKTGLHARIALLVTLILALAAADAHANGFMSEFKDTLDNNFDMSNWLSRAYGFMPIVGIITEPAIGPGVNAGLIFLSRDKSEVGQVMTDPPDVAGIVGMYTANGSWGVGGGYMGYFRDDSIRYRGGLGYASINLKYYPQWPPALADKGVEFNMKGGGTMHDLSFRIPRTRLFLGATYVFFKNIVSMEIPLEIIEAWELDAEIGGLGATVVYDNRDNTFTPDNGVRAGVHYTYYSPTFGGDKTFEKLDAYALGYRLLSDRYMLALRLDGRYSFEETPFYMRPYIELRGIPAMRYQGEYTLVAETEFRWDFLYRWSLVLFTGVGTAVPVSGEWEDRTDAYNFGAGFRYFIARQYGMRAGIDIARGPEQWALYITVGQAWGRY